MSGLQSDTETPFRKAVSRLFFLCVKLGPNRSELHVRPAVRHRNAVSEGCEPTLSIVIPLHLGLALSRAPALGFGLNDAIYGYIIILFILSTRNTHAKGSFIKAELWSKDFNFTPLTAG